MASEHVCGDGRGLAMAPHSTYTPEMGAAIYEHIVSGLSLDKIAALPGMPTKVTILRWVVEHADFEALYDRAKEAQTEGHMDAIDALNDEMISVADTEDDPKRANVRVHAIQNAIQNRIRLAQSLRRKKYGDKVGLVGPDGEGPIEVIVRKIGGDTNGKA